MIPPDGRLMDWLAKPSTMVNRFRIKNPEKYSDQYLYIPGDSFHWPGDQAKVNVDIPPDRYNAGVDIESGTYVLQGPAFWAWPADQTALHLEEGDVQLHQFRGARMRPGYSPAQVFMGRKLSRYDTNLFPELPGFSAPLEQPPSGSPGLPGDVAFASQVYEHSATVNGSLKYMYDFEPAAHHGWSAGTPQFWAVPPVNATRILEQVSRSLGPADDQAGILPRQTMDAVARESRNLLVPGKSIDQADIDNLVSFFSGKGLPVKVFTTSWSVDGGAFFKGVWEQGAVWNLNKKPLHAYLTIGGGISPSLGASGNVNLGFWWGESEAKVLERMQGVSGFYYFGLTAGVGFNIILSVAWDSSRGAFTDTYGLTISLQYGEEIEVGGGVGAAYTWFYEPPPLPYTTMKMPTGPS
jgi:hypothetical protein